MTTGELEPPPAVAATTADAMDPDSPFFFDGLVALALPPPPDHRSGPAAAASASAAGPQAYVSALPPELDFLHLPLDAPDDHDHNHDHDHDHGLALALAPPRRRRARDDDEDSVDDLSPPAATPALPPPLHPSLLAEAAAGLLHTPQPLVTMMVADDDGGGGGGGGGDGEGDGGGNGGGRGGDRGAGVVAIKLGTGSDTVAHAPHQTLQLHHEHHALHPPTESTEAAALISSASASDLAAAGAAAAATASTGAAASASGAPPPRGNVSHTRRCRAKVNNNFDRLLDALPPPPPGVEVKHKAQILAYAIDRFRMMRCTNMRLEMQLALSSPYQLQRWVRSVVSSADTLSEALKPFMALICLTKKWKYAELWAPSVRAGSDLTALRYIAGALPPTVEGEELSRLRAYRSNSRKYVFRPRSGVPGRVFLTMRPEWLPLLSDPVAFPRAPHAVRNKVEVTFAVPVIVNGSVQMVVEFYDTARRDYDPETLNMANEIADLFGVAFTGMQTNASSATGSLRQA